MHLQLLSAQVILVYHGKKRDGTSQYFLFQHSGSLIVRHIFSKSVLYAVKIISKYCCLASFMSLMTFFSHSLNCFLVYSYFSRLSGVVFHLTYSLFFSTILIKSSFVIHFSFLCLRLLNFFIFFGICLLLAACKCFENSSSL